MRARWIAALALGTVSAGLACESIFDDPIQCRADADCSRFAGSRCDVAQGVCVARSPGDDGSVAPPPPPPPNDADPGSDAGSDTFIGDKCAVSPKPTQVVGNVLDASPEGGTAEIAQNTTLGCDKEWLLRGSVYVRPGVTLTIEPGTLIKGDQVSNAALFVQQGARIVADGTAAAPIVFTSSQPAGSRAAGDWRGVYVLGAAPATGAAPLFGDPALAYGGATADDNSGTLRYVRVEYGAAGVVLGGVGSATTMDYVQVRFTNAQGNCYWFRGGRVSPKHLVCQYPGDEGLEFEQGYDGRAQFVVVQRTPTTGGHHALLVDNALLRASNVTLCGTTAANPNFGIISRNNAQLDLMNAIVTRYHGGIDLIGAPGAVFNIRSTLFKNNVQEVAYAETDAEVDAASPLFDDDVGFDENGFILDGGRNNAVRDVLAGCDNANAPVLAPATAITNGATTPPAGFDTAANHIGAVRDTGTNWMTGWTVFSNQ